MGQRLIIYYWLLLLTRKNLSLSHAHTYSPQTFIKIFICIIFDWILIEYYFYWKTHSHHGSAEMAALRNFMWWPVLPKNARAAFLSHSAPGWVPLTIKCTLEVRNKKINLVSELDVSRLAPQHSGETCCNVRTFSGQIKKSIRATRRKYHLDHEDALSLRRPTEHGNPITARPAGALIGPL